MINEKRGSALLHWLYERRKLLISILLFIAVFTICILYIHRTTVPLSCYEIGPVSDPERWSFTLTDGTELKPQDGILPVEGENTVAICETTLTEETGSDDP